MAISKSLSNTVKDQLLNYIANNCTMIIYSSATDNPATASAITGVLFTRSGLTSSNFTVSSGASVTANAGSAANATGTGTASCIIFKTGTTITDGAILAITTGSTALTSGQSYTPSAITVTMGTPT